MPVETLSPSATAQSAVAGKYLTFMLAGESYGIAVLKIREIIRLVEITSVPQMPAHVVGVINLRGKIIPVVDLRIKFGLKKAEASERTCIVVVQHTRASGGTSQMGLVVDAVEEVTNIAQADIEPPPDFGTKCDTEYILGMAKIKGKVKTLLDIDRVVASDVMSDLASAQAN